MAIVLDTSGSMHGEKIKAVHSAAGAFVETLRDIELASPLHLDARGSLSEQIVSLRGGASGLGYKDLDISLEAQQRDAVLTVQELVLADGAGRNGLRASGEVSFAG